jgi:hypothetical protein
MLGAGLVGNFLLVKYGTRVTADTGTGLRKKKKTEKIAVRKKRPSAKVAKVKRPMDAADRKYSQLFINLGKQTLNLSIAKEKKELMDSGLETIEKIRTQFEKDIKRETTIVGGEIFRWSKSSRPNFPDRVWEKVKEVMKWTEGKEEYKVMLTQSLGAGKYGGYNDQMEKLGAEGFVMGKSQGNGCAFTVIEYPFIFKRTLYKVFTRDNPRDVGYCLQDQKYDFSNGTGRVEWTFLSRSANNKYCLEEGVEERAVKYAKSMSTPTLSDIACHRDKDCGPGNKCNRTLLEKLLSKQGRCELLPPTTQQQAETPRVSDGETKEEQNREGVANPIGLTSKQPGGCRFATDCEQGEACTGTFWDKVRKKGVCEGRARANARANIFAELPPAVPRGRDASNETTEEKIRKGDANLEKAFNRLGLTWLTSKQPRRCRFAADCEQGEACTGNFWDKVRKKGVCEAQAAKVEEERQRRQQRRQRRQRRLLEEEELERQRQQRRQRRQQRREEEQQRRQQWRQQWRQRQQRRQQRREQRPEEQEEQQLEELERQLEEEQEEPELELELELERLEEEEPPITKEQLNVEIAKEWHDKAVAQLLKTQEKKKKFQEKLDKAGTSADRKKYWRRVKQLAKLEKSYKKHVETTKKSHSRALRQFLERQ